MLLLLVIRMRRSSSQFARLIPLGVSNSLPYSAKYAFTSLADQALAQARTTDSTSLDALAAALLALLVEGADGVPGAAAGGAVGVATAAAAGGATGAVCGAGCADAAATWVLAGVPVFAVAAAVVPAGCFIAGKVGGAGGALPGVIAAIIGGGATGASGAGRCVFAPTGLNNSLIKASLGTTAELLLSSCSALL